MRMDATEPGGEELRIVLTVEGTPIGGACTVAEEVEGTLRFEGLDAGSYELQVFGFRSGSQHREAVEISADRDVLIDMTLTAPNEEVSIDSPGAARPLDELLRNFGIAPESLLGPGFAVPEPG